MCSKGLVMGYATALLCLASLLTSCSDFHHTAQSETLNSSENTRDLIGGTVANPNDYPASVWTGSCSATVVGPRTLFIAAHCVSGRVSFSVGPNRYTASCYVSREYNRNSTADYALCQTTQEVTGIQYESVNVDPNRMGVGDQLTLTGYGCTRPGGGGGVDGRYRVGQASIVSMPRGSNNDIVTRGRTALCFGDSGGAAFHVNSNGNRVVVSTNSRGDIRTTSYLSATHTTEGRRFFAAWANITKERICGFHDDAVGCRNGGGGDGPKQRNFEIKHSIANIQATMGLGHEDLLETVRDGIMDLLDDM